MLLLQQCIEALSHDKTKWSAVQSSFKQTSRPPTIKVVNHVALSSPKRVKTIQQGNFPPYVLAISPAQYNGYTDESSCNYVALLLRSNLSLAPPIVP